MSGTGWPDQPSRRSDRDGPNPSPEELAEQVVRRISGEDESVTHESSRGVGWPDQPSRKADDR